MKKEKKKQKQKEKKDKTQNVNGFTCQIKDKRISAIGAIVLIYSAPQNN